MMKVNETKCIGCGLCVKDCFPNDIEIIEKRAVIHNQTCIKCGHCIAVCPVNAVSMDDYDMAEVKEYDESTFDIEPDRLLNFIKFRRSVRQYRSDKIEKEMLVKIIEAGRFTQTGVNRQDVSYTVVQDNLETVKLAIFETLKMMGEQMLASDSNSPTAKRYAALWSGMYEAYKSDHEKGDQLFFNAPAIIVVSGPSTVNAALASSNMELMANALNLGTFFSGFFVAAAMNNPKIKSLLAIDPSNEIVTCMVLGHPAVSFKRTVPRKKANIEWQ